MTLMLRHMVLRLVGYIGAISVAMAMVGLLCKGRPLIDFAVGGVIPAADLAFALVLLLPPISAPLSACWATDTRNRSRRTSRCPFGAGSAATDSRA